MSTFMTPYTKNDLGWKNYVMAGMDETRVGSLDEYTRRQTEMLVRTANNTRDRTTAAMRAYVDYQNRDEELGPPDNGPSMSHGDLIYFKYYSGKEVWLQLRREGWVEIKPPTPASGQERPPSWGMTRTPSAG